MGICSGALRAAACAVLLGLAGQAGAARQAPGVDFADVAASGDSRLVVAWIVGAADNRSRPFAIVDKKEARLLVFTARGRLVGATPVLLGVAIGDDAVPGLGDMPPARIPMAARTTPAGRFATEPGHNLDGEAVVWFDYDAGLAIHRLRPNAAQAARHRRLAATDPAAHRVSAGCVVVPVAFYESVVARWLGRGHGVLYVLPETRAVQDTFAGIEADL
jgi:hypothetical protein